MRCQERFSEEFKIFDHAHQTSTTGGMMVCPACKVKILTNIIMQDMTMNDTASTNKHNMIDVTTHTN